jgi:hypothetical protein
MIGGRRSLHDVELASGARIVVALERDIFGASSGASAGTDPSTGGADERAASEEPESDALERAAK